MTNNIIGPILQAYAEVSKHLVELNVTLTQLQDNNGTIGKDVDEIKAVVGSLEKSISDSVKDMFSDQYTLDELLATSIKKEISSLFYKFSGIVTVIVFLIATIFNFIVDDKIQKAITEAFEVLSK